MEKMGCILHGRLQPIGFPARWMPLPWQKLSRNSVRDVNSYTKTLEETEQKWMLLVDYSTRSMELSPEVKWTKYANRWESIGSVRLLIFRWVLRILSACFVSGFVATVAE
jgi:hypothetical protein